MILFILNFKPPIDSPGGLLQKLTQRMYGFLLILISMLQAKRRFVSYDAFKKRTSQRGTEIPQNKMHKLRCMANKSVTRVCIHSYTDIHNNAQTHGPYTDTPTKTHPHTDTRTDTPPTHTHTRARTHRNMTDFICNYSWPDILRVKFHTFNSKLLKGKVNLETFTHSLNQKAQTEK